MTIRQRPSNPIVMRELLTRERSWTTPITITLYLCLLGAFALVMFSRAVSGAPQRLPGAEDMASAAFLTVAFQLVLALLFIPPLAAGGIAGERERGTLDMLVLGRLRPFDLAWGKLLAAVAYPLLLVIASLPILLAAFLYAGLDLGQLAITQAVTVTTAVTLGAVATLLSSLSRTTVVATVTSYAAALGLYVATALAAAIASPESDAGTWGAHPLVFANPFYALKAVTTAFSPAGAAVGELVQRLALRSGTPGSWGPVLQPWQLSIAGQAALTVLFVLGTKRVLSGSRLGPRSTATPGEAGAGEVGPGTEAMVAAS